MTLSFIIPYHNEPTGMLHECISGIVAQSDERIGRTEIIVVDDGSERSAEEELRTTFPEIKYLRQENQGLSAARNAGLAIATGEYIHFVDADDTILPPYSRLLSILESEKPDILSFRFTRKGKGNAEPSRILADCGGKEYLSRHNLRAAACLYVFSRECLGNLRFQKGIYHEDELFTPQLFLQAERIIDTDAAAYYYRPRPESITTATTHDKVRKRLDDALYVIRSLKALHNKTLERRIAQLSMDYIYNSYRQRDNGISLKQQMLLLKTEGLYPLPVRRYTAKYLLFSLATHILAI